MSVHAVQHRTVTQTVHRLAPSTVPQKVQTALSHVDHFADARATTGSNGLVTLPRPGHTLPAQDPAKQAIVNRLNGYLRPDDGLGSRNRIVHTSGPHVRQELKFPLAAGQPILDGTGQLRAKTAANATTMVNYGQTRKLELVGADGKKHLTTCVYAFQVSRSTNHGKTSTTPLNGWVPLEAIKQPLRSQYSHQLHAEVSHRPVGGDAAQHFTVTGGGSVKDTIAAFGDLKVRPNVERSASIKARDYLTRPGGVVNLLYSLPGHGGAATDTFKTGAEFIPDKGVPRARIPLFLPKHPTAAERKGWRDGTTPHHMDFVYGRVGDRFGWISADALKPK